MSHLRIRATVPRSVRQIVPGQSETYAFGVRCQAPDPSRGCRVLRLSLGIVAWAAGYLAMLPIRKNSAAIDQRHLTHRDSGEADFP